MASYAGIGLGLIFTMNTSANPKARQFITAPGADGVGVLDMGSRGKVTRVEGALGASTRAGIGAAMATFGTLQLGGARAVLADDEGVSWLGVILVQFAPVGKCYTRIGGGFAKKYQAEFFHTL